MDENKIEEKLKTVICEILEDKTMIDDYKIDAPFINLGINSVKFVRIIIALEEEFDIEFSEAELKLQNYKTWKNLIHVIKQKINVTTIS